MSMSEDLHTFSNVDAVLALFAEGVPDSETDSDTDHASQTGRSQAYYQRNRERRCEEQRKYIHVHRTGRQHISHAQRQTDRRRRQLQLEGKFGTYVDDMGWKRGSRKDVERTPAMADHEAIIYRALKTKRRDLRVEHGDNYTGPYCAHIDLLLHDLTISTDLDSDLHRRRRIMAGYAQEISLWKQGEMAFSAARQDGVLIFRGNGVNRVNFRRRFGF